MRMFFMKQIYKKIVSEFLSLIFFGRNYHKHLLYNYPCKEKVYIADENIFCECLDIPK